jgi:RNA polymerase sigma-70 factor (ECF subfamily)
MKKDYYTFASLNFEEIYHQHKRQIYNLVLNYLQNTEDAEEITQDVFVTVHQQLHSFNEQSSITTWIYRIAINKCLDCIKSKKAKKRFGFLTSIFGDNDGELKHDRPNFNHPGILMEQKEEMEILFSHINALPENQKTALILHKIDGMSQTEVAEIMQTSAKSVESLVQRAKTNLKEKIKNSEG